MSPLVQRTWMEGWMDARRAGISLTTEHLDGRDQSREQGVPPREFRKVPVPLAVHH